MSVRRAAGARVPRQLLRQAALADPGLARQAGTAARGRRMRPRRRPAAPPAPVRARRTRPPAAPRRPRAGRARLERGVLVENRLVQLTQPRARLDAELVDQRAARRAVGLERVRLAPGPVQGHQQLPAQALAQRLLVDERLELGDELRTAAEREVGVDAVLERREPQLLQPPDLGLEERLVGRDRRAAARARARAPRAACAAAVAGSAAARAVGSEALEAEQVEPVLRDPQLVARRRGSRGRGSRRRSRPARAPAAAARPPSRAPSARRAAPPRPTAPRPAGRWIPARRRAAAASPAATAA